MRINKLTKSKLKKYIYTESDLGEGLLDEGVYYPNNITKSKDATFINLEMADKKIDSHKLRVPNVQEDFTYSYYC